jgi:hypothetical protein
MDKTCTKCKEDWPADFYARNGKGGRRAQCKACSAEQMSNIRRLKRPVEPPINPFWHYLTCEWNSIQIRN